MPLEDEGSPEKAKAELNAIDPPNAPDIEADTTAEADAVPTNPPTSAEIEKALQSTKTLGETVGADDATEPGDKDQPAQPAPDGEINVVLVGDIDVLYSAFVALRNRGEDPDAEVKLDVDNVTFVLNTLDSLAGETNYLEVRKRRPQHRSLSNLDRRTESIREKATLAREQFAEDFDKKRNAAQAELDKKIAEMQKRTDVNPLQMMQEVELVRRNEERRLEATTAELKNKRDELIKKVETESEVQLRRVQGRTKLMAVLLPPIVPLMIGAFVFGRRRQKEREGIASNRLRKFDSSRR